MTSEEKIDVYCRNLPVSAAEWHLLIMWLLLFAYEDLAVLCRCRKTDVETY